MPLRAIEASDLATEAETVTRMLKGRVVAAIRRHRASEVLVEFSDGARLFVDADRDATQELSITGIKNEVA